MTACGKCGGTIFQPKRGRIATVIACNAIAVKRSKERRRAS